MSTLRLAEAIRLGSLLIPKPMAGDITRCAIGMANRAAGFPDDDHSFDEWFAYFKKTWPWLNSVMKRCPSCNILMGGAQIIWHVFDWHTFNHALSDKKWTLEQLCDWIDSFDPTPRTQPETLMSEPEKENENVETTCK